MVSTNVSQTAHDKIAVIGKKARAASLIMAKASSKQKNNVLLTLTDLLGKNLEDLLKAITWTSSRQKRMVFLKPLLIV